VNGLPHPRVHSYLDRRNYGKAYWKIHKELDKLTKKHGRYHRTYGHDLLSAVEIARKLYPNDPYAIMAAQDHIIIDEICSRDPEFRLTLEMLEKLDAIQRSRHKRSRRRYR
jgi:hypothetical protein